MQGGNKRESKAMKKSIGNPYKMVQEKNWFIQL